MKNNCSLSPLLELKPINHIASQINRLVDPGASVLACGYEYDQGVK